MDALSLDPSVKPRALKVARLLDSPVEGERHAAFERLGQIIPHRNLVAIIVQAIERSGPRGTSAPPKPCRPSSPFRRWQGQARKLLNSGLSFSEWEKGFLNSVATQPYEPTDRQAALLRGMTERLVEWGLSDGH